MAEPWAVNPLVPVRLRPVTPKRMRGTPTMKVNMLSVKDMVKDNKQVTFVHFKEGELWYRTEDGFEFPVPAADVGNATMLAKDKALLFMRYIRRHYEMLSARTTRQIAA
jgi:hypothetical protein